MLGRKGEATDFSFSKRGGHRFFDFSLNFSIAPPTSYKCAFPRKKKKVCFPLNWDRRKHLSRTFLTFLWHSGGGCFVTRVSFRTAHPSIGRAIGNIFGAHKNHFLWRRTLSHASTRLFPCQYLFGHRFLCSKCKDFVLSNSMVQFRDDHDK